jgi:hypothetical protein
VNVFRARFSRRSSTASSNILRAQEPYIFRLFETPGERGRTAMGVWSGSLRGNIVGGMERKSLHCMK